MKVEKWRLRWSNSKIEGSSERKRGVREKKNI